MDELRARLTVSAVAVAVWITRAAARASMLAPTRLRHRLARTFWE